MRAAGLLAVLCVAKLCVLPAGALTASLWALPAYFAPDVLTAAAYLVLDRAIPNRRAAWTLYAACVGYVALNVPIGLAVGGPLTPALLRATRGTITDSIAPYLTWSSLLRIAVVAGLGAVVPGARGIRLRSQTSGAAEARRSRSFWRRGLAATACVVLALMAGRLPLAHVDTGGRHRNAFTALLPVRLPAAAAASGSIDWRASPMATPAGKHAMSRLAGSARGMNVLMVVLESAGARYLRPYGAGDDPMPNLTRLAARALVVDEAFAAYPESIKGLLGVLCSSYPVFGETAEHLAARPCDPIAGRLRAAGYRTALFHSGRFGYLGMDHVVANRGFDVLEDAGAIGGHVRSSFGVDEPATVHRVLEWIDGLGPSDRFFVSYLPIAGHHPYGTHQPGPFEGSGEAIQYRNALHEADAALGDLLEGLRARHLDERTLVLVFGDHGEAFGQHAGNTGHVLYVHDENVRVPYVVHVPGATTHALRAGRGASLIDTAPTILDLLGLPPAPSYQGTSILRGGSRMALFLTDYSLGWLGLQDGCWKYELDAGADRSALYDRCADPEETIDVSGIERRRVEAYRRHVLQWSAAQAAGTM